MTEFDPNFALEVMRRRQSERLKEAADIHLEKFMLQMEGRINHFGRTAHEMDKRVHALWAEADSYDSVIEYLDDRIWSEKTFAEKTWEILKDMDYRWPSVDMVEDVLEAEREVLAGVRP